MRQKGVLNAARYALAPGRTSFGGRFAGGRLGLAPPKARGMASDADTVIAIAQAAEGEPADLGRERRPEVVGEFSPAFLALRVQKCSSITLSKQPSRTARCSVSVGFPLAEARPNTGLSR